GAVLEVYLGNFPGKAQPVTGVEHEPVRLGNVWTQWAMWETKEASGAKFHAEAMAENAFGSEPEGASIVHLLVIASSAQERQALQALAAGLRSASKRSTR